MSLNIISALTNSLDDLFVNNTATATNEQPSTIKKLLTGIVPSFLLSLVSKKQSFGADTLRDLFDVSKLFNTDQNNRINETNILKNAIWGGDNNKLLHELANYADVTPTTAGKVLDVTTPHLLNKLSDAKPANIGIMDWIIEQKDNILAAIPGNFNLASALGIGSLASLFGANNTTHNTTTTHNHTQQQKTYTPAPEPKKSGGGFMWLLLLAVAALLAWWLFGRGCNEEEQKTVTRTDTMVTTNNNSTVTQTETVTTTKLDADGNYIYEVGDNTEIKLADGTALTVGNNSTEYKLFDFLTNGTIDNADKTKNWITCDRIYFKTGGSELTDVSSAQIENIAKIMKNFPNAAIKLGGYTDNTGDAALNKKLSGARAQIVADKLAALGVTKKQVEEAVGYGPEHPIASNDTDEGRAQNRRVDLKVGKK